MNTTVGYGPLPLGAPARRPDESGIRNNHARLLLITVSYTNLLYYRIWSELLTYTPADRFMFHDPYPRAAYWAVIVNVILGGFLFWLLSLYLLPRKGTLPYEIASVLFLLSLLIPLNGVRSTLAGHESLFRGGLFNVIPETLAAVLGLCCLFGIVCAVIRFRRPLASVTCRVLLCMAPMVLLTFGQAVYRIHAHDPAAIADKPTAAFLSDPKSGPRVVWFVFDEWDYQLTFENRKPGIRLPEIERFRDEAFSATHAYSPYPSTISVMPALLTGRLMDQKPEVAGQDELRVAFRGSGKVTTFGQEPTIFSAARREGFNTGLVGWYLPYCRILNEDLSTCSWYPMANLSNSMGSRFPELLLNQTRSLVETPIFSPLGQSLVLRKRSRVYGELLDRAVQLACDRRIGLSFIHLNVPHPPFFYNAQTGRFDLSNSPISGYWDNLVLADRTLGALRRAMEEAGVWENTTVVVTSDHWYRSAAALTGRSDHRVPYMVRFPHGRQSRIYERPFNVVVTHDLMLAILRSQVSGPADVAAWLDQTRRNQAFASP